METETTQGLAADDGGADILGTNQVGMRARNERLVLTLLRRHGALAKADIARITGLSAQTVSVIMRALETDGLLMRGEPVRGKVGQPSVPMRLDPDGALFYGLKIGRRSAEMVLVDFVGEVRARSLRTHPFPTPEATLDFARQAFAELQGGLGREQRARVSGLGVAMPFQMWEWSPPAGVPAASVARWEHTDVRAELQQALGLPVLLENDASAACGAELVFGRRERQREFFYLYIGYFIGGGLALGGSVFTGASGNAAALGSMPVPRADGGIGQLIDAASLRTLEQALIARGEDTAAMWEGFDGWRYDPDTVAAWVETAAAAIAFAVVAAIATIEAPAVIIDGWLPETLRAQIVAEVERALDSMNFSGIRRPAILPGTVGPHARSLGAASLPLSDRYLLSQ